MISLGVLSQIYQNVTDDIEEGQSVLDVGCGTGNLTYLLAAKGAIVTGIDINPEMLAIADKKRKELTFSNNVTFNEMGVAELDKFGASSFDAIYCALCFSELSDDERRYAMEQILRLLRKDGRFILIDEVIPKSFLKKVIFWTIRIPLAIITYVITQTTTKPLINIQYYITDNGMEELNRFEKGNIVAIIAKVR